MIPSRKWFPQGLQERAAWYKNFNTKFAAVAPSLGFVPADVTIVAADSELLEFLADIATEQATYNEALRQYRVIITEGDIGEPTPAFPASTSFDITEVRPTGLFERLDDLVKRIRVVPNYTAETGALLGIIPETPSKPLLDDLKPAIAASESFGGFQFNLDVTRMGMPQFKVQVQRKGSSTWQDVAFATNNPVSVTVTPTTPDEPERILVRAVLLKNNAKVGQPSDPTYVTVNP
ncbi:MAG: hypothetical protein WKF92_07785 [Pyrinomonadaceae bacterium]